MCKIFKVRNIEKRVRVTAKISPVVADAILSTRDTVASTATNAPKTRTAAGTADASTWRPPRTRRGNASARWAGTDRNATNVSLLSLLF